MTFDQFAYWLQGFVELTGGIPPTQEQWDSIIEHLGLIFNKVTSPVKKAKQEVVLVEEAVPYKAKEYEKEDKAEKDEINWVKEFEKIFREAAERGDRGPFEPWKQQPGWPGVDPGVPMWPQVLPDTMPGTSSPSFPGDYYYDPYAFPRVYC